MTNKQYLKHQIELTNQLNFAAERRPYDPDFYNSTLEEIEAIQRRYCFGRKVKYVLRIILWLVALLSFMFITYTAITNLQFAPEGWGF